MQQAKPVSEMTLLEFERGNRLHEERFATLNREWLTKYFYVEPQDEDAFADPEGAVLARRGVILFAALKGEIVGTGSLIGMEEGAFEIAKMAVTEAYQAKGIGACLLAALIERGASLRARKLFIVSNTKLENAIKLYRRHGFRDSAELRHTGYERGNITLELALAAAP